MVAKGVNALVVFPDAGEAILPALRSSYKAGVVTVPVPRHARRRGRHGLRRLRRHRRQGGGQALGAVDPGEPARRRQRPVPQRPRGQQPGHGRGRGAARGARPDRQVHVHRRAAVRGHELGSGRDPEGPDGGDRQVPEDRRDRVRLRPVAGRRAAGVPEGGRSIPPIATSDGNVLACFWQDNKDANPDFKLFTISTQNDHARLAIQWAVALATGGEKPATMSFPNTPFENSVTGDPNPVTCEPDLPGDIYLSAEMSAEDAGGAAEASRLDGGARRRPLAARTPAAEPPSCSTNPP